MKNKLMLSAKNKKYLLSLSRKVLSEKLIKGRKYEAVSDDIPKELIKPKATFVTLIKNGELRGCVGKLFPDKPLYQDVIENTRKSAFSDFRFPPLSKEELGSIKIEISILSTPEELKYSKVHDLIEILKREKPGVILDAGLNRATFLPQVWEKIESVESFLTHLCIKAGLDKDAWRSDNLKIKTYQVEKFKD